MVVRDKIPVGIYANSNSFNNLYKLLKYDLEFHVFGTSENVKECIKYMLPYKKYIIVHCNELLDNDLLSWYLEKNICLSIDITNLSKKEIITELPKYKNLIIEISSNIDLNILKDVIYYYYEYNKYNCGIVVESSSKDNFFTNLRANISYSSYKDIVETSIRKYNIINICEYIIPYRELFYSTKDECIIFKDKRISITTIKDFYKVYKSLYTIDTKCKDCIVSTHCNKYSVNCDDELQFNTDIIKMMLNKAESV